MTDEEACAQLYRDPQSLCEVFASELEACGADGCANTGGKSDGF